MVLAMDELLRRLEAWFASHRPRAHASFRPPATDEQIEHLRAELGVEAPADLISLLTWHDGQEDDAPAFQHNRGLLGTMEILEDRLMYDELLEAGDIRHWDPGWIPVLRSWGGDVLCIDATGSRRGVVGELFVRSSEDELFAPEYPDLRTWLAVYVETLEAGLWADEGGDVHPQDDAAFTDAIRRAAPGYPVDPG